MRALSTSPSRATVASLGAAGAGGCGIGTGTPPGCSIATGPDSRPNIMARSATPPTPSAPEWCTVATAAALPWANPSTSVQSHSGRERSKPADARTCACSNAHRSSPGGGAGTRRTCRDRSKSGSTTQAGVVASRTGGTATRWRRRGIARLARSMTCWNAGQPGLRSNTATAVIVERSSGSCSMFHIRVSAWLIRSEKVGSVAVVSLTRRSVLAGAGAVDEPVRMAGAGDAGPNVWSVRLRAGPR